MKKLPELIRLVRVGELASRSHGRLGAEMADDDAVTVQERGPFLLRATVAFRNGQAYVVRIDATSKGLRYACSCSSRKGNFCAHVTAVVLVLQRQDEVAPSEKE